MTSNTNFTFKGIPLNQIYSNDGTNTNIGGHSGIPTSTGSFNNFNAMKPNPIGFFINGVDLSNNLTAKTELYINTSTIPKPPNAKTLRVISVGGAGGGGGGGGFAQATAGDGEALRFAGGFGGIGGFGSYAFENVNISNISNISVIVGNGGVGGNSGGNDSVKSNYNAANARWNNVKANGGNGNAGGSGNVSYIVLDSTNPANQNIYYGYAVGGNGGSGGKGAEANAEQNDANGNYGANGSPGTRSTTHYSGSNIYPLLVDDRDQYVTANNITPIQPTEYGFPPEVFANPWPNIAVNSAPGNQGAVRLVWLYD